MHFDPNQYPGTEYLWYSLVIFWSSFSPATRALLGGYLILLIYIMVNGSKKEKFFYVVSLLVLIVTCLNPWMTRYLVDHWRFHERHFRLFWLIPVPMGFSYICMEIYDKIEEKYRKLLYIGVAVLMIFSCYQVYVGTKSPDIYTGGEENKGMPLVDNIYKVEDDIVETSRLIEEDSGTPDEVKMALFNTDALLELRVYDASILETTYYGSVEDHSLDNAVANEDWVSAASLIFNGDAEGAAAENLNGEYIKAVLSHIECDYVILPKVNPFYDSWLEAYPSIGEAGRYNVLKVGSN